MKKKDEQLIEDVCKSATELKNAIDKWNETVKKTQQPYQTYHTCGCCGNDIYKCQYCGMLIQRHEAHFCCH